MKDIVHCALTLYNRNLNFLRPSRKRPVETILGKGENAGNQHFLLFPKCFLSFLNPLPDHKNLTLSKLIAFADDKINVTLNVNFCLSAENI